MSVLTEGPVCEVAWRVSGEPLQKRKRPRSVQSYKEERRKDAARVTSKVALSGIDLVGYRLLAFLKSPLAACKEGRRQDGGRVPSALWL